MSNSTRTKRRPALPRKSAKTERITFRVTKAEHADILSDCVASGLPLSDFSRLRILKGKAQR